MPISAVLFDADDTLWDFQLAARLVTRRVLDGRVSRYPELATLDVEDVMAIRRELGRTAGQDDVVALRRETFRLALDTVGVQDVELTERLTSEFLEGLNQDLPLYSDTLDVLDQLQGRYSMGIVSNGTKGPAAGGIAHYFQATALGPVEGFAKPDPRLFRLALDRLGGVPAEESVMVGDHDHYDVVGAQQVGMRAVLIDRRSTGSDTADAVIDQLAELPAALDRIAGS
jgi:putative hydrolase of the HAD superfamily